MANALSDVPVVQGEGKFLKFAKGEKRLLTFVGLTKVEADPKAKEKGFADKDGNQLQLEFKDMSDGKQKFYTAKDGSSKLIQALKALPTLEDGTIVTIEKTDEYNFSVSAGGEAKSIESSPF